MSFDIKSIVAATGVVAGCEPKCSIGCSAYYAPKPTDQLITSTIITLPSKPEGFFQ